MMRTIIFIAVALLILGVGWLVNQRLDRDAREALLLEQQQLKEQATRQLAGFKKEDLVVGAGQEVKSGDTVTVNYIGRLADGKKFDSSYDRGYPSHFTIGLGQVIKGWDLGLLGMKVGGKRKLTIPPDLAYGDKGSTGVIPAKATLTFEVQLLKIE